jgi:hypothetical protein
MASRRSSSAWRPWRRYACVWWLVEALVPWPLDLLLLGAAAPLIAQRSLISM